MKTVLTHYPFRQTTFSWGSYLILLLFVTFFGGWANRLNAQNTPCVADEKLLAKWDFDTPAQQCNGLSVNQSSYWDATVPLMTGGNQYCPQYNDGSGQAMVFEKGFGNTNDFRNLQCLAGFWRNGGNQYFRAPGYDHTSTVYNAENPSGNVWFLYKFLPGQAGSLTGFAFNYVQSGYRDGGAIAFEKVGMSVWRNGVKIYETTMPITAANVNNPANPIHFTFPTTSEFTTDGSSQVVWEIAYALVHRYVSVRTGADNYCILGTTGAAVPTVTATPATCAPAGGMNGMLTVQNFSAGERYDYTAGATYTGSATYATATPIPAGGVIASNLPLEALPAQYTVRIFRQDCYAEKTVTMPPTFCPYTCDFPQATVTPNPATCSGSLPNNDASIVLTDIVNMDRVGISSGRTYAGPAYSGAIPLNGASTFTLDNSNGVIAGSCTEYYTLRFFNGAENTEKCIYDVTVGISPVSCDGCKIICADIVSTDSEEVNSGNNTAQGQACKTDQVVDLQIQKTVNVASGESCPSETEFVFTVTVENIGDLTAKDINIKDDFPDEMAITDASATIGTVLMSFGTIDWRIDQLAPSAQATMTITGRFLQPGSFQNCAFVTEVSPANDPNTANNTSCADVTVTGAMVPTIQKSFSPEFAQPNVPVRLQLKIFNNEPNPIALTQDLVDELPDTPGQMVIAPTPALASSLPGIVAAPGATQILVPSGTVLRPGLNTISVDVIAPVSGDYVNLIQAGDLQTTACSNPTGARAEVFMSTENVIAPMVSKAFSADVIATGQTATLTIKIEN
nr:DUF11 domain-containing protein [Flavilitoribacter sp.]